LSIATFPGTNLASAALQRAKSFLELVEQRSPGRRTQAHLTKIKHRIAARPHERALPKVRMALPILPLAPPLALFDLVAPPPPVHIASIEDIPILPLIAQTPFQPGPFSPPPSFIVPPMQTPSFAPPVVNLPTAPVPEPGTWASMLLGFALIGWTLQRRRKEGVAGAI
jgi:hypothetical protein